jgi:signal transduction histidine kinase/CheY-like chemotaxis protein
MTNNRIIYYLLAAFIAGNFLLIYIQYNSSKNINILINGNEKVLAELDVSNYLRELNRDIAFFEGRNVNNFYSADSSQPKDLPGKITKVQSDIDGLQKISDDDSSVKYINLLNLLVHQKLALGRRAAGSPHLYNGDAGHFNKMGTRATEQTDSIRLLSKMIEKSRQKHLAKVTSDMDVSGKKALNSGTILIVLVLISGAILFWIIIIIIKRQNQLIQKLNISEKKNKDVVLMKETFLANTSHEIRTPMNAILGFTNLLQRKNLDEESKEYVLTIQNACEKLLAIINDVLDLSKIEAGMMRIESSAFSIRGLLHSIETMFRLKSAEKIVTLSVGVDGTIFVKVSNEGVKDGFVNTGITVRDSGIGIEKDKLQFIFERFQQVENSITRKFGGTGLGLSIVNDLVHLQHGSIHAESTPGKGTTFKINISYKISAEQLAIKSSATNDASPELIFNDIFVLVVEDNEINQSLMKYLFKSWRLNYELANNGKEAIDMLKHSKYDLILMDIQMPEMDGYTTARIIREDLKLNTPIIAMTAHALSGERERCLSYGMDEYISKPIREELLRNLITQFVQISKPAALENEPENKLNADPYQYIHPGFMKEFSRGDIEYEKMVTEQFTEAVPGDLHLLKKAWQSNRVNEMRQLAHNMKTTISVMGLNEVLQPYLDALEYEELSERNFRIKFTTLKLICNLALEEARQFYSRL